MKDLRCWLGLLILGFLVAPAVFAQGVTITTTSPLPSGTVGQDYSTTFMATGGSPGYSWSIPAGTSAPPGLTLSLGGVLSGIPTQAGIFAFDVLVRDGSQGLTARGTFELTVNEAAAELTIDTPSPLASPTEGIPFSMPLSASGGIPPYTWTVAGGQLPPGLILDENGLISGTATQSGDFTFTARVTDVQGNIAERSFLMTVLEDLSIVTPPSLPDAAVGSAYVQTLAADGGEPPYTWFVVEGGLPEGLSLSTGGVISGTPQEDGTFTFQVEVLDSSERFASQVFTLTVLPPAALNITTTSPLRTAVVNEFYTQQFEAEGGLAPYIWTIATTPPPGLSFTTEGFLQGRPLEEGTFVFNVTVIDSREETSSREFTLNVAPPLAITTLSPLPDATLGAAYSVQLEAVGGEPPYTWSRLPDSGTLPRGLFLNTRGAITGTPTEEGTFSYGVQVTDLRGRRTSAQFSLTVGPEGPVISITTTSPLPSATLGVAYSLVFDADGTPPYQWALGEGSLPPGLSLSTEGVLSGTPSEAGLFTFVVLVEDAADASTSKQFNFTVEVPALEISNTSPLPNGIVNELYFQALSTIGGSAPYTWALASGELPPGVALDSSGSLNGTPSQVGEFSFRLRVSDAAEASAERDFVLTITSPQLIILTGANLPQADVGAAYAVALEAGGGEPPYTWAIANGSLPEGLTLAPSGEIAGTPTVPGDFSFGATVTDSADGSVTRQFTLSVQTALISGVTIGGLPAQANPREQPELQIALDAPYPVALTGVAELTFTSDTTPPVDDPGVQFANEQRTASFSIPAGSTAAQFGDADSLGVQTGSVAGRILIALRFEAGGVDVSPVPQPQQEVEVLRTAPSITSVEASRVGGGFQVVVVGISSPRDMTQATFRFTARAGSNLQTTELTVNLNSVFTTWYQLEASAEFGSAFRYVQPFTLQGDANAVASISVTLTNSVGASQAGTATLPAQ